MIKCNDLINTEKLRHVNELEIHISGLGPCGLITLLNLYYYFEPTENPNIPEFMKKIKIKIFCYEQRLLLNTLTFKQARNETFDRRKQVVTIQNDVIIDLPNEVKQTIINYSKEIWRNSRNIPIYVFEDELLKLVNDKIINNLNKKIEVNVFPAAYHLEKIELLTDFNTKLNVIMNCEGSNSGIKKFLSIDNELIEDDYGLGIFFVQNLSEEELAQNCILTIGQMKYLINSTNEKGFVNVRLSKQEFEAFKKIQNSKKFFNLKDLDESKKRIIINSCRFFGIKMGNVKGIQTIQITVECAKKNSDMIENQSILFNLGDSMMKVHFWPGRGLNSAIKTSVAACRRLYQIVKNYPEQDISNYLYDHLNIYEEFCKKLIDRELLRRSVPIMKRYVDIQIPCIDSIIAKNEKSEFEIKCNDLLKEYKQLNNWNILNKIEKIKLGDFEPDDSILFRVLESWPISEMKGQEIYPVILCPDPRVIRNLELELKELQSKYDELELKFKLRKEERKNNL